MEYSLTMLRMDFVAPARLLRGMDDDTRELIIRLCAQAGMAMEDTSVTALTIGTLPDEEFGPSIDRIEKSVGRIWATIKAARGLSE